MTKTFQIGQTVRLPDGPYGQIIKIEEGVEYGDPVWYLTVDSLIGPQTRWVRK